MYLHGEIKSDKVYKNLLIMEIIYAVAFGELEVSKTTLATLIVLASVTFIGVAISSLRLISFGSEKD